ncbi:TonB-dependent receptor [Mucilaginibacter sp. AK015]|uniref:SusC/RagA family TonB-linked outer membrane protein n=1 Tax=Mucilaginibacter sp. AK015 TaxID=2723072 RepID=UPI00183B475F|nr:TonB-dependent receptor [Mucilaginibacter sp. AK015]MBB5396603.1 TonB-linked SusC/RagA family outer membrane protein [Mucilaginibacter sp. AK015]
MGKILRIALLFASFLICATTMAQTGGTVIKGTVTDDGGALPGVTVSVKDGKGVAVTDVNGRYSITVAPTARVLVFKFVGLETREIAINGQTTIDAKLKASNTSLNEVVVIGYGSIRRADITSSISSVSEKDIKNLPVAGVDQAIQGKVAGVTVMNNSGQPGGGVSVRVRGITSATGSNEPLYVIDGVQFASNNNNSLNQDFLGGGSGQTGQSVLATLSPSDIESIDILKDASAQAIYGSRGANGVVIINTKRGKAGQSKLNYDAYVGFSEIPKKLKVMDLRQYAEYRNSLVNEVRAVPGSGLDSTLEFRDPSVLGRGTDWQDEIYQRGVVTSHQLSVSGGTDRTQFYFSGGYLNQTGTLIKTGFDRYTVRASIDHQVNNWLKTGLTTNMSKSSQQIGLSDGFDAVTSTVLYNTPVSPVRDIYGNYITNANVGGYQINLTNNPVTLAQNRDVRTANSKALGALYAEVKIIKGLTLRNEVNYNFNLESDRAFQPFLENSITGDVILSPSRIREQRTQSLYWDVKNFLNFDRSFGKHSVSATLGHEVQRSDYDYINANRNGLVANLPSLNAGLADLTQGIGAGAGTWSMESYFARAGYTFNDRYAISGTIRRDGSSSFGPGKRWGTFPAVSASWTATNEEFLKDLKNLSYLKVRLGYGEVGNQSTSANAFVSNIQLFGTAPFGPGSLPFNVANPDLGWESVKTYNAGIDLTTLSGKAELTVDVYKKITTNMLLASQLPSFSGLGTNWNDIQSPITNAGEMTNTGIDIGITSYNIRNKDFNWKTNLTFSHYKNKLVRLNNPTATLTGIFNEYGTSNLVSLTAPGSPIGSYYGFVTDGLFKSQEELAAGPIPAGLTVAPGSLWLGDIRYKDLDGNGIINDKDARVIGDPNPKFTYGFTNTFSYKGVDLSVFLYGSYGGQIFNYTRRQTEAMSNSNNNQLVTVLNRYTDTNTETNMPRYNQWTNNNTRISDRYIESGSYLRIQNVALGYNLPKSIMSKLKIASVRLYASVQNLYTFTKYTGYDPELGAINSTVGFMNVDNGHYPIPRTFTFGTNVQF